jgi:hypothetical protein
MKKYTILFTTVILATNSILLTASATSLKTCAVVPFGSSGIERAEDLTALYNNFNKQVTASGKYKTINNTVNKLKNAGYFGKKYTSITSAAMNAGIILRADYVIYGQVTKSGSTYSLTTTLVDIHNSKAIRSVRSKVEGSIDEFIQTAPSSNISTLLGVKVKTAEKKQIKPTTTPVVAVAATPTAISTKKIPHKNNKVTMPKKITKSLPETKSTKSKYNWSESFSWTGNKDSQPKFNNMEYENVFLQYINNHLELGGRFTTFSLDVNEGEFLGTINTLTAEDTSSFKLFADWMFNPYIGIELTSDKIAARTHTDTEDSHSDGKLTMSGPIVYAFGRYPFQIKTEKVDFIIAPYLGLGFAMFSANFDEDAWWTLGYGSPVQWEQAGSPSTPAGDYSRKIDVNDYTGLVIAGGCTIKVYNGISLDFYIRAIDAETDAVFTRTHTTTGEYEKTNGHFPLKTTEYGFGLRYSF